MSATAVEVGGVAVGAGTLTRLDLTITGITAVTNPTAGTVGRDVETDQALRERYYALQAANAIGGLESMRSAILRLTGVTHCGVRDNSTNSSMTVQGLTINPHSVVAIVEGGTASEIASVISRVKPAGVDTSGTTSQSITTISGFPETIRFEAVTAVPIQVALSIDTDDSFDIVSLGDIRTALTSFVNRLRPGDSLDTDRARAQILASAHFSITALTFRITSTSATITSSTIINLNQRLTLDDSAITITQV